MQLKRILEVFQTRTLLKDEMYKKKHHNESREWNEENSENKGLNVQLPRVWYSDVGKPQK